MINSQLINRIVRQYIDDEINVSEAVDKMNAGLAYESKKKTYLRALPIKLSFCLDKN